jgi:plastocyanin
VLACPPMRGDARRLGRAPLDVLRACAVLLLATCGLLLWSSGARAATGSGCPPIRNKPHQVPHVHYAGVQHLTYCDGPITVAPGQNVIRLNGTDLFPRKPGYITRFDPELVYTNGKVPRVDVLHLHHAVWVVNFNPQFAVGEEKTIQQLPKGFGWRTEPSDHWLVNDMLHDLVGQRAKVYIVWRLDFVPDTAAGAASIHPVETHWMSVAGNHSPDPRYPSNLFYPVFNALKGMGEHGRYTFPDQAKGAQRQLVDASQSWTPSHPVTLIGTAGHLHPGGLYTDLEVQRGDRRRRLFRSEAHYYEPAGEVSWDVAMTGTPPSWRVKVRPGDTLSVHATYNTRRASWYEVMGIMPVAVYDGTDVGGRDAFSKKIPEKGVLTHGHLAENNHHGGQPAGLPDPLALPNGPFTSGPIDIKDYQYAQGSLYASKQKARPPTIRAGQSLKFKNLDGTGAGSLNAYHTITACRAPCNRSTGIAYPIANGSRSFDSGELGVNYGGYPGAGAPASGQVTWSTPKNLKPGTYTYFCRVHPFMRGSFRVVKRGPG